MVDTVDIIKRMDRTLLCIQGPPGTGKTYTTAHAIVELLKAGKRIGVTANSHKAVLNVLKSVKEILKTEKATFDVVKIGGESDDPVIEKHDIKFAQNSAAAETFVNEDSIVIGGTAWVFSRPGLQQKFDYLFVDEAGQFSLANVVATGCSAKNIVLVGDQMQLSQPTQGAHPGDSGKSALEYYLEGRQTIPEEKGVLLNTTWRMHPDICDYISNAFYESRLQSRAENSKQRIDWKSKRARFTSKSHGIEFVSVEHDGNTQGSEEEVEAVAKIYKQLLKQGFVDNQGKKHEKLSDEDILVVAPFNLQVRMLKEKLGRKARVGTVDKFQGQEAQVVIISMASSSLEESPRGTAFLLEPNRLNVAVSRARALAVVVANRQIMLPRYGTIRDMEFANRFCRLVHEAQNG
ncbi:MAG: AAA domain-containing protein [Pirellulaceae bacterium]